MDLRVISIGTLASNPLWNEKGNMRTGHATCTLIRTGKRVIVVDPGLPAQMIALRLHERSGVQAKDVTHVFLTTFKPDTLRGVLAFEKATWWIAHDEREQIGRVHFLAPFRRRVISTARRPEAGLRMMLVISAGSKRCSSGLSAFNFSR